MADGDGWVAQSTNGPLTQKPKHAAAEHSGSKCERPSACQPAPNHLKTDNFLTEHQMSERFELLDIEGDISGKLRLIYGSGPADPAPFVLTLTPQYVARASGKTPPVSFHEIEKYADDNAGDLREMVFREKGTGRLSLTLE